MVQKADNQYDEQALVGLGQLRFYGSDNFGEEGCQEGLRSEKRMAHACLCFGVWTSGESRILCGGGLLHTCVQGQCEEQPADLVELHPGKGRPGHGLVNVFHRRAASQ